MAHQYEGFGISPKLDPREGIDPSPLAEKKEVEALKKRIATLESRIAQQEQIYAPKKKGAPVGGFTRRTSSRSTTTNGRFASSTKTA